MTLGSFSNNGLAFGVAFTLQDAFSQTAAQIQQSMSRLTGATNAMQDRISGELNRMTAGAAMFGAALAVLVPIAWGVEQASIMEQVRISFNTLMGDATAASSLIKDLRFFADWTPFETLETIQAGRSLLAYGVAADKIIPTLTNLGNVASGLNLGLNDLIQVYGRNLSQPFIFSRDIYQFAMRGIPIMDALAQVLGVAKDKVLDLASNRGIKPEAMVKAFELLNSSAFNFGGMMEAQSQSLKGLMSTAHSYVQQVFEAIGNQFLPTLKDLTRTFISLAKSVTAFVNTPLGGWIVKIVGALAVLVATLGLLSVAIAASRLMALQLVWVFSAATREAILTTIATRGLTAGLWQMATALYTALAPILIWLVPIALLVYLIYKAVNAFRDMKTGVNDLANAGSGIEGFLRRLGGYIMGIVEVLKTWNGTTFTLSDDMVQKFQALGILDNFLALSTWIVRIKTMLGGIWDGFMEGWNYAWNNFLKPGLDAIGYMLESIGIKFDKAGGTLAQWAYYGKIIGYVFAGIAGIIAFIVIAVGGALVGVVKVFQFIWSILKGIYDFFAMIYDWLLKVNNAIDSFVRNMMETLIGGLPGGQWLINTLWGDKPEGDTGMMQNNNSNVVPAPSYNYFNDMGLGAAGFEGRAAAPNYGPMMRQAPVVVPAPTVNNNIFLDGEPIFNNMQNRQELQNARRD